MELLLITFLPLVAVPLLWTTNSEKVQRWIATLACAAVMVLCFMVYAGFDSSQAQSLAIEGSKYGIRFDWFQIGDFNIDFAMNVDGISVLMLVLTGVLGLVACISAWTIKKNVRGFFAMYLLLMTGMLGTFVSMDLFMFYVFWEIMLLPMYFLIGVWGGPDREFAAIKFFLYTLAGSVVMLGAFLATYFSLSSNIDFIASGANAMFIPDIIANQALIFEGDLTIRIVLFFALFIGFAIKVPVFPFHTWLPLAHVEAPTPISVILAGVLLKLGGYGMMRMAWPWFPDAVVEVWPILATLAVISIVYGALCALAQDDWKKMVAYSSVSHMGYVLLGMCVLTPLGVNGAMLQMFNHGTISGMMFLCVGVIYDQAHHRDMNRFGGLAAKLPKYTFVAMIAFFGGLGLPGLSGFISEMAVFFGAFQSELPNAKLFTILGTLGIVMGAVYILIMLQKVFLGTEREKPEHPLQDLKFGSIYGMALIPLAAITIYLGVWPQPAIDIINKDTTKWLEPLHKAQADAKEAARLRALESGVVPSDNEEEK